MTNRIRRSRKSSRLMSMKIIKRSTRPAVPKGVSSVHLSNIRYRKMALDITDVHRLVRVRAAEPVPDSGGYLFRFAYIGIGGDVRGIDQDNRLRLKYVDADVLLGRTFEGT